ncbi:MAG: carbohydrate kinase [Clostridia bacterium]|nr:carbohydrate kinase [Clostridia bacterium]
MRYDIVAMGELLIDFTEAGFSPAKQRLFEQNPGGAVANVACGAARLGLHTAFIGKVGNDMHGRYLRDVLQQANVNTDGLLLSDEVFTTLAFVSLSPTGEREFSFARKPGADTCLYAEELLDAQLTNCAIFHVGSLSMTDEPVRSATLYAVQRAKAAGAVISYDPNYRAPLWKSVEEAKTQMRALLPYADLVKLSDEETELLTDETQPEAALDRLLAAGAKCAVVTLGKRGAMLGFGGARTHFPTIPGLTVMDTTGAGDAFWSAFLSRVVKGGLLSGLSEESAARYVRFANAAAGYCVGRRGAIPSMPTEAEVQSLL